MGKYVNLSKTPAAASDSDSTLLQLSNHSKKLWGIVILSVIGGITVLGISWVFLEEINQKYANRESGEVLLLPSRFSTTEGSKFLVVVVSLGVVAIVLQLFTSLGLLFLKEREKDSKSLIFGFSLGQGIIQTVLLICAILIVYKLLQSNNSNHETNSKPEQSSSIPTGHGFWMILLANVVFHLAAILYLLHIVMKTSDEVQMEELTSVVIHRRVASRIPSQRTKSKRHARLPSTN